MVEFYEVRGGGRAKPFSCRERERNAPAPYKGSLCEPAASLPKKRKNSFL